MSFGSIVSLLAGPGWGLLSDRRHGSPAVLVATAACAMAGVGGLSQARDLPAVLVSVVLLSGGFAGLNPIIDARVLELSGPERSGFGPLRAWGSLTYVVSSFAAGAAIDGWGIHAIFAIIVGALAGTAVIGATLHRAPRLAAASVRGPGRSGGDDAGRPSAAVAVQRLVVGPLGLFLGGAFVTFTGLSSLMAFQSLRFAELAAPATLIGLAAALGAAVEVPVMLGFPRLAARFGTNRLVVVGAVIFAVRELGVAVTADPNVIVALAAIGGVGYASFLIGGITYVSRHAPADLAATAQGLFSGLASGLAQVVAGIAGGTIAGAAGLTGLFAASGATGVAGTAVVARAVLGRRAAPNLAYSTAQDG